MIRRWLLRRSARALSLRGHRQRRHAILKTAAQIRLELGLPAHPALET